MSNRCAADANFWCGISSGEVATVRSVLRAHDKFCSFSMYSASRAKRCPAELLSSRCIPLLYSTAMAMWRERGLSNKSKKIVFFQEKGILKKDLKKKERKKVKFGESSVITVLVCSLSSHRHSYIGFIFSSRFIDSL
jgi:hypothetical protein